MQKSRSNRFHAVGIGMALALLASGGILRATGEPEADAAEKSSDKGLSPNASITSVSGLEIDTYKMNLMYSIPMTPSFKVTDGISYGVSARYSSNIFSNDSAYLEDLTFGGPYVFSHIPTLKSPFGAGYEFGFGIIYLDYRPKLDDSTGSVLGYTRQFVLQTPDGSSHQLYLLATQSPDVAPHHDRSTICGVGQACAITGEPMGGHLKGDTYIVQTDGAWTEQFNPNAEYFTADGSMIRAIYHQATSVFGSTAFWEIFYPDGRKVIYAKNFRPDEDGIQGKYYKQCGNVNLNADYPQEMLGWYPTRVENARGVGFSLSYENTSYPYLVTKISDDTDRKNFGSADILFTIADIGGAGRYTDISYPGANGTRQNVHLTYIPQAAHYTLAGGDPVDPLHFPSLAPGDFNSLTLTLLQKVEMPGGYVELFSYFPDCANPNDCKASGRVKRIDIPTGGVHHFAYQKYFHGADTEGDFGLGISSHILDVRAGAASGADRMTWFYREDGPAVCGGHPCWRNAVRDPAGNETAYLFNTARPAFRNIFTGTLAQTDFYQGLVAGGALKKRVKNEWNKFDVFYVHNATAAIYTDPVKPQIVKTTTEFWDDPIAGAPGTLIEENLGWDY